MVDTDTENSDQMEKLPPVDDVDYKWLGLALVLATVASATAQGLVEAIVIHYNLPNPTIVAVDITLIFGTLLLAFVFFKTATKDIRQFIKVVCDDD